MQNKDLRKRQLTLASILEEHAKKPINKSQFERGIREGTINWMEFVVQSTWHPGDCSEVLPNYLDGGKGLEDDDQWKHGAKKVVGPSKVVKEGQAHEDSRIGLTKKPLKLKCWFWMHKGQSLQPLLGFLTSAAIQR
jgi:hypothetical protein